MTPPWSLLCRLKRRIIKLLNQSQSNIEILTHPKRIGLLWRSEVPETANSDLGEKSVSKLGLSLFRMGCHLGLMKLKFIEIGLKVASLYSLDILSMLLVTEIVRNAMDNSVLNLKQDIFWTWLPKI